jgi:D-glycero-alpha-D-manno-heptose-7-phosphate kinase
MPKTGDRMIVSSTPLRISFVGGGTDIPDYFENNGGGAVVNAAIDKYVYIIVNKKFDGKIRVAYSKTEIVDRADDLQHPLVREALKLLDIREGVEIMSLADIPSRGTGLGSSSAFTVGLLNALHTWLGNYVSPQQLAEEAVRIEREIVGDPGGLQDQYIAAYGGLRFIQFHPQGSVEARPIFMSDASWHALEENLLLFYTGAEKPGIEMLSGQIEEMHLHRENYEKMRWLAQQLYGDLRGGTVDRVGDYMHENWECKKKLHQGISNSTIEEMYSRARKAGATGGKITGAGGRGFLLLFVPLRNREMVRRSLSDLREEHFHLEKFGSQVIFVR